MLKNFFFSFLSQLEKKIIFFNSVSTSRNHLVVVLMSQIGGWSCLHFFFFFFFLIFFFLVDFHLSCKNNNKSIRCLRKLNIHSWCMNLFSSIFFFFFFPIIFFLLLLFFFFSELKMFNKVFLGLTLVFLSLSITRILKIIENELWVIIINFDEYFLSFIVYLNRLGLLFLQHVGTALIGGKRKIIKLNPRFQITSPFIMEKPS